MARQPLTPDLSAVPGELRWLVLRRTAITLADHGWLWHTPTAPQNGHDVLLADGPHPGLGGSWWHEGGLLLPQRAAQPGDLVAQP